MGYWSRGKGSRLGLGFEVLEFPLAVEQGGSHLIQTNGLGLVNEALRRRTETLWYFHADALLLEFRDPQSRIRFVRMVVFLPLTLVATHQHSRKDVKGLTI